MSTLDFELMKEWRRDGIEIQEVIQEDGKT
jgi:hypothetical protein